MSGALGVIAFTEGMERKELREYGQRLESLGYQSVWIPELAGREPVATCAYLVGSGILNVHVRDATATAQARHTLAELSEGRFLLGLGVSHPFLVEARGHEWVMPVPKMRAYLEGIAAAQVDAPPPNRPAPIYLAAHGPKLLALARERADGAFLYLMPPERIAEARAILGPDRELLAVVRCCLCDDPDRARRAGREALRFYISLPPYQRAWSELGLDERDFAGEGSDRLIDTALAWGDATAIRSRIQAYFDAGATQVLIGPTDPGERAVSGRAAGYAVDWKLLEALAPTN